MTLPRVGSDLFPNPGYLRIRHFNPRSPCGERPKICKHGIVKIGISIHAPRVGSDPRVDKSAAEPKISIHAPRVGSDLSLIALSGSTGRFQSTLPVWGATRYWFLQRSFSIISIHAPRVGSDLPPREHAERFCISIHAPRVGSDVSFGLRVPVLSYFNPRSPCGERPGLRSPAPRPGHFNPRSPCGERRAR